MPKNSSPNKIRFPVLLLAEEDSEQFLAFWDRLYGDFDEEFYTANIGKPLTPELIKKWFVWKNGTPLSPKKAKSILQYSLPEEEIAADADNATVVEYLNRPGGAIWRIFFLHLQHPTKFPIYDQHVHRAMAVMRGLPNHEIPLHNPTKVRTYLGEYIPFFARFDGHPHRQVDRALWACGRFLKSKYGGVIREV